MKKKKLFRAIGIILFVAGVITVLGVVSFFVISRFKNPDMTEMRLFLTYWRQEVAAVVGAIVAFIGAFILNAAE